MEMGKTIITLMPMYSACKNVMNFKSSYIRKWRGGDTTMGKAIGQKQK
jgi:phage regulator Rha-like protein